MAMKNLRCGNCKFFDPIKIDDEDEFLQLGECRRYPPRLHPDLIDNSDDDGIEEEKMWLSTRFPIVDSEMWCGEWEEI